MDALLLLVVCLALGMCVARAAQPPVGLATSLNWWVLNVALPALVLVLVPRIHVDSSLWFLVASQWLLFLGAWALVVVVGRWQGWDRRRIGALVLVCGLGNTSFVGYPLISALRGPDDLALAVVADQVGCFVALAVGGALVAALYSGQHAQPSVIARRIAFFPPLIAFVAACIVGVTGGWPPVPEKVLQQIGSTLTPLALFSVGLRLKFRLAGGHVMPLLQALSWKLLIAPLLVLGLGMICGVGGPVLRVGVLETAMAPMISAAILADQHRLESSLANSVLGIGIVLSLVSVPMWNYGMG